MEVSTATERTCLSSDDLEKERQGEEALFEVQARACAVHASGSIL